MSELFTLRDIREITDLAVDGSRTLHDAGVSIRRGEITILNAPPNRGKTFLAMHVALCVANRGHNVLIVSPETSDAQLSKRCRSFAKHMNIEIESVTGRLLFLRGDVSILDAMCVDHLQRIMLREQISLLSLDPWVDVLAGAEENDAATMHSAMKALRSVAEVSDAACLLAHHTRKTGDVGRGSSAIEAAADAVFVIRDDKGGPVLECRKQRNAARSPDQRFFLRIDDEHGTASISFEAIDFEERSSTRRGGSSSASRDKQLQMAAFVMRQTSVRISDLKRRWSINGTDAGKFLVRLEQLGLVEARETHNGKVFAPK